MPIAVALIVLVIGSLVFHVLSPWTFTELASNWSTIDLTVDITLWVCGFVFVAVNLFMAYCVVKYKHRDDSRAKYDPENTRLETILTIGTTVGVALMLTPGLFVWAEFVKVPDEAMEVEAVGQQWHWTYRLPGEDGEFGESKIEYVTADNPLGLDPEDPLGQDDVVILNPEVHIPIDVPVKFNLRSKDVLHDFAVAQFRVKMDLVPGMTTYLWFTPTKTGRFEVLCEELCGIAHHTMRGAVVVDTMQDYQSWVANYPTFAETQSPVVGNAAAGAAQYAVCAACHGQQGEGLAALNAPKIAGQEPWYIRRQIDNYKKGLRGAHEDDVYGRQMAPMSLTLANEQALENVIAHVQTLPDNPSPETIEGDVEHGAELYVVCAYCHGKEAQGIEAINAPRMAGMNDWYLVRQLQNFKSGVRGGHPQDYYGMQMGFMGRTMQDEQSMRDVVAYINTL